MKKLDELAGILKQRRQALALNQHDMLMKIGMSQQQYQRIEAGGDVRLSTLLRVLEGMDLELQLVPRERGGQPEGQAAQVTPAGSEEAERRFREWDEMMRRLED
ncbi:helix-turn-helix domain-containing protein [Chimaeribacter arupi]|uniref:Helix-turn-helix domain-containing protein n=2 Tax=Yersiniaceae TaxID=1903411 RepID=A0A2N5ERW4_9GAMM|nr:MULTISPECIES: helix-turn-helix domain-containing protein [Yersiniaceae]MBS0968763.1 helix-turn-helix domain-containing protein [Nissabacter archeti]MDV5138700.1 helix-turn-helix domain-containing protein [Chimaeribacter arupi]PLR32511.1 helix-turn-helix domain-containing protein [Chimaeribacter arupi]PLR52593.1 helix-turn-helix domain-containing protein [Chimaeribacter arupi]WKZ91905.1 helix-turn-helix domain-containing protein [Chimaeribacter arupi]